MELSQGQVGEMLAEFRRTSPALPDNRTDRILTAHAIVSLSESWPLLTDELANDLQALCWEVSVCRDLCGSYGTGWQRDELSEFLDPEWWALLVAVLLAYSYCDESADGAVRGRAFKCLNAAFAALDAAEVDHRVGGLPNLHNWADRILKEVFCEFEL